MAEIKTRIVQLYVLTLNEEEHQALITVLQRHLEFVATQGNVLPIESEAALERVRKVL